MSTSAYEVNEIIRRLDLEPHPEGGHYRRTWAHPADLDGRPLATAILYLLVGDERSHWHRIDGVEMWHHYAGGPLELLIAEGDGAVESHVLGSDVLGGQQPQVVVPADAWQSASAIGDYALVGCTVTPGFDFAHFELAPPGWHPGD